MKNALLAKLSAVVLASLLSASVLAQGFPPPNVNVVKAEFRELAPVAWVSGNVISRNNARIAAEVTGRLISLAELGAKVKKGETIARIDDTTFKIQLREEVASVQNAESRLQYLESEVKRKSTLAKRNLSAITDLDETISQRDVAKGDLAVAKSRLAQTQQKLAYTDLKAPFDGIVAERISSQGEYVNSGTAIIRLVETANLEASIFAPLTAYRYLKEAESLVIESALGKDRAPIKSLVPVSESRSQLMEVRLDMTAVDWPVGLSLKAAVASGAKKQALAVPRDALVLRRDGTSIFKVDADNKAQQIKVSVGIGAGAYVEVIGNIQPGDQIIVRGAERLQPGQAVNVKPNNDNLISGQE